MSVGTLIEKLRSKKRTAERSVFSQYLTMVKELANGTEIDSGEAEAILRAAGKDESTLETDVQTQQQRLSWYGQMQQHQQAAIDRRTAEAELYQATAALQAAIDKLSPAIESARLKMQVAEQTALYTQQAEARLSEHVLDHELLEREQAVVKQLQVVVEELAPLLKDREHKQSSLTNAELNLKTLTGRDPEAWPGFGSINPMFWVNKDMVPARERVDDLKSQLAQLNAAIQPRQQEQRRLQNELNQIHQEKLTP